MNLITKDSFSDDPMAGTKPASSYIHAPVPQSATAEF